MYYQINRVHPHKQDFPSRYKTWKLSPRWKRISKIDRFWNSKISKIKTSSWCKWNTRLYGSRSIKQTSTFIPSRFLRCGDYCSWTHDRKKTIYRSKQEWDTRCNYLETTLDKKERYPSKMVSIISRFYQQADHQITKK